MNPHLPYNGKMQTIMSSELSGMLENILKRKKGWQWRREGGKSCGGRQWRRGGGRGGRGCFEKAKEPFLCLAVPENPSEATFTLFSSESDDVFMAEEDGRRIRGAGQGKNPADDICGISRRALKGPSAPF